MPRALPRIVGPARWSSGGRGAWRESASVWIRATKRSTSAPGKAPRPIRRSSLREDLPHLVAVPLPPVEEDADVRPDAEVTHAQVQVVLRLVHASDLGARRDPHFQGRFE